MKRYEIAIYYVLQSYFGYFDIYVFVSSWSTMKDDESWLMLYNILSIKIS